MIFNSQRRISNKIKLLIILVFWSLALTSILGKTSNLIFHHINKDEGLSSADVNTIQQGKLGFIWIGTANGLNKYNGYEIEVYRQNANDSTSLPSSNIHDIYLANNDTLWIGTNKGLCRYNYEKDNFKTYREFSRNDTILPINFGVVDIKERNNNVYFLRGNGSLYKLDEEKDSITEVNNFNDNEKINFASEFDIDNQGNVWIGSDNGLIYFDLEKKIFRELKSNSNDLKIDRVYSLLVKNKKVYCGTSSNGIIVYDKEQNKFTSWKDQMLPQQIHKIYEDRNGDLWIGDEEGLVYIDNKTDDTYNYYSNEDDPRTIEEGGIGAIFKDKQGNLWASGRSQGVNVAYNGKKFRRFNSYPSSSITITKDKVKSVQWISKEKLYVGYYFNGLDIIDLKSKNHQYIAPQDTSGNLPVQTIEDIYEDEQEAIWVTPYRSGLLKYNRSTKRFNNTFKGKRTLDIRSITQGKQDNLWLATQGSGLGKFDKTKQEFEFFTSGTNPANDNKISSNWAFDVLSDFKGNIWVATAWGLNKKTTKGGFKKYFYDDEDTTSLSSNTVYTLFEDSKNRLWIGTTEGLNRFKREKEKFVKYTSKDGLINNTISAIQEDANGNLWIATKNGISKFDPEKEEFENYKSFKGIPIGEFYKNSSTRSPNGEIYFGGIEGITAFYPEEIQKNKYKPPIVLTGLEVNNNRVKINPDSSSAILNKHINTMEEIKLEYHQNDIELSFVALNYINSSENQYAYKLEGYDNKWKKAEKIREATYTNLDPGNYTFRVKASNNDGIWNNKGKKLNIIITPPFWQTRWFTILAIVSMILLIVGIIRYRTYVMHKRNQELQNRVEQRTEQLEEKKEELEHSLKELKIAKDEAEQAKEKAQEADRLKSEFLANMSHEIRTPMNSIIGFAKVLKNDIEDEEKEEQLDIIYNSGKNLLDLINDILDLSKVEAGKMEITPVPFSLPDFIKRFSKMFEERAKKKDLYFNVEIDDDIPDTVIGDDSRINQILINLVGNAIKFTKQGGVTITCDYNHENEEAILEVEDTGVGIPPEKQEQIFEPFRQADASTTREFGGTGLGLAISMELIGLMDGELELDSELGEGTCFKITLPLSKASASITHEPDTPEEVKRIEKKIGIVEDDKKDRMILKQILKENGLIPIHLNNTKNINEEVIYKEIDLILLDLIMEEPDGFELNKILKEDPRTAHLPVVVCSGSDQAAETIYYGVMDYVKKPIQEDILLKHIYTTLSVKQKAKNIFVIDDDKTANKLYSSYLKDHNYNTFTFNNAGDALNEIHEGNLPDFIILDLMMPEMDGFEFLSRLRDQYDNAEIPVVIVTAKELSKEEKQELREDVLAMFKKGEDTEDKFISYIDEYFSNEEERGKKLVQKKVESLETKSEKEKFFQSLASLPELVDKISKGIKEQKTIAVKKYSKNIKRILGKNRMDLMKERIDKMHAEVKTENINWNRVLLNFLEFKNIYNSIPKEYLQGEISDQITETASKGEEKEKTENSQEEREVRILVAEDNPTNQKLIKVYFDRMNIDCEIAENGKKALNKIRNNNFDILFLDMQMPVMDGMETLENITEKDEFEISYIVALTANAMKGDEEKYLKAGCDEYMAKPIEYKELKRRIDSIKPQLI